MFNNLLAIDVQYSENEAYAAGCLFHAAQDEKPEHTFLTKISNIGEYSPGEFYKRELPCIMKLLKEHQLEPSCIIVDGFVYLDSNMKEGLGKKLFDELNQRIPVIGVAKRSFIGTSKNTEVLRGESENPLYVTSVGVDHDQAKEFIRSMHGPYRIPTILKEVDRVCREAWK